MAKITSETDIANLGLSVAGAANLIGDINTVEDTEEWRMCNAFLWQAVFEAMSAGEWGFATARAELATEDNSPAFGPYQYRCKLPNDVLQIIAQVDQYDDDIHYKYKREGQYILTNEEACFIRYISRIEDTSHFPPLFIKACYTNLAVLIRNKIKGADEWYLRPHDEYKKVLRDALSQSEMEDYVEEGNNDILEAAQ